MFLLSGKHEFINTGSDLEKVGQLKPGKISNSGNTVFSAFFIFPFSAYLVFLKSLYISYMISENIYTLCKPGKTDPENNSFIKVIPRWRMLEKRMFLILIVTE